MKSVNYRMIDVAELASQELHENVKTAEAAGDVYELARVELGKKEYAELMLMPKTGLVVVADGNDSPLVGTLFGATSMENAVEQFLQTRVKNQNEEE